ncbi:hypothetical protein QTP86_024527 [Hemibagrus guttatus]|nr:hypothetical protein QTP86_024527 [Hemibagrus guttatus]
MRLSVRRAGTRPRTQRASEVWLRASHPVYLNRFFGTYNRVHKRHWYLDEAGGAVTRALLRKADDVIEVPSLQAADEAPLDGPGYTLDGVYTHSHSLTLSHTTDNLEKPINLQCMSLDRGRKPEYPEETPEARGEHANSTHTAEVGIKPPTLEADQRQR